MEHKLSKLKKVRQVTLSDEERAYLRGRIAQLITTPVPKTEPIFQRGVQHGLRIALSSFIFVVFVGGSVSAIASNAYPGDPLYDFKWKVNERIKSAFLETPEEKVAFAKNRVEKRVQEIKTLAESQTLTKEKQAKAQKALDSNIEDLSTELNSLSDKSPDSALSITANLEESLKADKEAIQTKLGTGEEQDAAVTATIEAIDDTLKKVSEQEVKIIKKEIDNIAEALDNTTTGSLSGSASENVDPSLSPATDEAENTTERVPTQKDGTQQPPSSTTPASP